MAAYAVSGVGPSAQGRSGYDYRPAAALAELPGGGFQVRAWPGHGLWARDTLPFVAAAAVAAATDVSASPRGLVATLPAGADPWPVLEAARAAVGLA